jgi:hypothetical protein
MISNNVYYFDSGTSWVVPAGVTGIQVECYGSSFGANATVSTLNGNYSGGSYSKSNVINVTGGSTVYMSIGSLGGNTWFNTTNAVPTSSSSASSACLAVGGNTASASQIAANCGDIKYKGGNGLSVNASIYNTASGGQAGPNGNGADVTNYYTVTPVNGLITYSGGGANGGSSGSLGVPPYGRSGTGTVGSGAYWNGTSFIYESGTGSNGYSGFTDPVGQYSYFNNLLNPSSVGLVNYGPTGGSVVYAYTSGCCINSNLQDQKGFIVITLLYGRKYIVVNTTGASSFTVPNDFASIFSVEAVGAGGDGNFSSAATGGGGGGGGGYSQSTSITASITAGSTVIYTTVPTNGAGTNCWLNVGTNSAPTLNTTGVLAKSGSSASLNTGGAGANTTGAIGTVGSLFGGGTGGAGWTTSRFNGGGGGGSGGPLGAGGAGGAANNTAVSVGAGGGGGANNGSAGGAAGSTSPYSSGAGGTGSSGAGAGGTGNTAANTIGTTPGASGPSGGGGGGGSGFNNTNQANGGAVNNSVYQIGGGTGGGGYPRIYGTSLITCFAGAGGGGNTSSSYVVGGTGLVVFAYTPQAAPVVTAKGNFFLLF